MGEHKCDAELLQVQAGLRSLIALCEQGARHNGEYWNRTGAQYERGKAVIWDAMATELRGLLGEA